MITSTDFILCLTFFQWGTRSGIRQNDLGLSCDNSVLLIRHLDLAPKINLKNVLIFDRSKQPSLRWFKNVVPGSLTGPSRPRTRS